MNKENIEEILRNLGAEEVPEHVRKIAKETSDSFSKQLSLSQKSKRYFLVEFIMKNNLTKLAAAAAIIITVSFALYFSGSSVSLTTVAVADMVKAMKAQSWVHIKSGLLSASAAGPKEMWVSFESKIAAAKMTSGQATVINLNEHKSYTYDPNIRSITIDYVYENDFPEYFSSPASIVESMNEQLEAQGAQITTSQAEYKGQKVLLQKTALTVSNSNYSLNLYIQPDKKLLLAAQIESTDSEGNKNLIGEITFDYPKTGPTDIYSLSVPRDAAIVNKLPDKEFMDFWDIYRQKRQEATEEYIAFITKTNNSFGNIITNFYADYKSHENHRLEYHSVFTLNQGRQYKELWPEYKEKLGESFESLMAWSKEHFNNDTGNINVYLYDGRYEYSTNRSENGEWSSLSKIMTSNNLMPTEYLEHIGWPVIGKTGHIIKDAYAEENNLICIERLQQGSIYQDIISLPARFLFYIYPQKDYLCVRKVTEWRPGADWQKDKNWLGGIEPGKIRNGSIVVEDMTETVKAPNGHWYPKTIEIKQTGIREDYEDAPLELTDTKNLYIKTNPEFPQDIFNAEKLPGQ